MSDAFSDLWNSSAPSKPDVPKTLGGSAVAPSQVRGSTTRKTPDVFSLLASTNSSLTNSRTNVPQKPTSSSQPIAPAPKPPNGNDAFQDLLEGTISSSANNAQMTIAERAAQVEQQRLEAQMKRHQTIKSGASAWQGLDSLANPTSTLSTATNAVSNSTLDDDDWGFGSLSQPQRARSTKPIEAKSSSIDDDWGLDDFANPTGSSAASTKLSTPDPPRSRQLWDMDDLMTANGQPQETVSILEQTGLDDQNDGFLRHVTYDEDDILGDLGKPIDSVPRPSQNVRDFHDSAEPFSHTKQEAPQNTRGSKQGSSRPVSPPPHILGQIVEMGFSVQQARVALAATDTGLDVQGALEMLLSNGAASSSHPATPRRQSPANVPALPRGHRDRIKERSRSSSLQRDNDQRDGNIQEQADKLIAQASEIGLGMLNKASIFWREGKERIQKVYEERATGSNLASGSKKPASHLSGRPKWMTDMEGGEHEVGAAQGTYRDDTDNDQATRRNQITSQQISLSAPRASTNSTRPSSDLAATTTVAADLLSSNEPTAYVSPWRRGKPKPKTDPETFDPSPKAGSTTRTGTPRAPSPVRAAPRASVVPATQSAISISTQHKDRGAEKFRLGQYSEAEAAYSTAIAALPDSHLLLVPLYNNRALTRLKTGDYPGAVDDTTVVLVIIGLGYHPARELMVSRADEGASVDLADGVTKALKRRAEAFEGREKWEDAKKDWEVLAGKEWVKPNIRSEAVRGAGRCRRMVQAPSSSSSVAQPIDGPRKPKPRPARPQVPSGPSEALAKLRSANDAAEAEDQARYDLKDSVDARILAWKSGKEANIRALLASLDLVLWPELGLQKVGMAELVSPAQVKIRYTKTIAKLHPDKVP